MKNKKCTCGANAVPGTAWCYTCSPTYLRSASADIKITIEVAPARGPAIVKHLEKFVDESTTSFIRRTQRAIENIVERAKNWTPSPDSKRVEKL